MKKLLSTLLAAALCLGMGTAAAAAGTDNFILRNEYGNFKDVAEKDWYYSSVKSANEYGLVKGNPDGSFNPDGRLTVAEAIVMADRVHMIYRTGEDTLTNGEPWYQSYVDYAIEKGIIRDGDFEDYTRPVKRGEMAYIFSAAVPYADFEELNHRDNAVAPDIAGHEYEDAIKLLYRCGIAMGNDTYGTFAPDSDIKRAEAAAIIARVADPQARKAAMLVEDFELGPIAALGPVGAKTEEITAEGYTQCIELSLGSTEFAVYAAEGFVPEDEGWDVLDIPRELQADELAETLGLPVTAHTISFGKVPAYRFDFVTEDETPIRGCYYVVIYKGDLYTIAMASEDAAALEQMANSIKLSGKQANEEYKVDNI